MTSKKLRLATAVFAAVAALAIGSPFAATANHAAAKAAAGPYTASTDVGDFDW